jgi:UMF1 family MFS transporter
METPETQDTSETPSFGASAEEKPSPLAVGSWVLYDLANTIFSLGILSLYLPVWVVDVMGGSDAAYGYTTSISMAVIFVLSPLLGALTDQAPRRLPFLIISTLVCVSFTVLFGQGSVGTTLVFFGLANVAYQAGLQFYDALLPAVSTEENRGKVGGIGVGVGYLGSVVAIIAGEIIIGNTTGLTPAAVSARYVTTFQAVGVLFLLFALPCFFFVRERPRHERHFSLASVGAAVRQVGHTLRSTRQYPGLVRFLVGRVFYTDAINTVILFMGVYVVSEVGFSDTQARRVLFVAIIFAIVGGLLWSQIVDRLGPKRTLDLVLFMWMFIFAAAAAMGFFNLPGFLFWIVAILTGIALGGTWTADRPYMLRLTPPARVGEFYGLYGMVGRFAAITGPLLWGVIVDELQWGRPAAILTLLVGIIISYAILRGVSDERREWPEEER